MTATPLRNLFRSLSSFSSLLQTVGHAPVWVGDAAASVVGPKVDDAIRGSRKAATLLPGLVTIAAAAGAVFTSGIWRLALIVIAVVALIWAAVLWLSWSGTRRAAAAYFTSPVSLPTGVGARLLTAVELPEGRSARVVWAWHLREPAQIEQLVDRVVTALAAVAGDAGFGPEELRQLQHYLRDR